MTEDLWPAYRSTRFEAATSAGPIAVFIGEKYPDLDAVLERHGRHSWCFITAWNPGSVELPEDENDRRNLELRREIESVADWSPVFTGAGHPLHGTWRPERSFLVFGVARGDAVGLGRRFGQNAVVWGKLGGVADLLDCRPGQRKERSPSMKIYYTVHPNGGLVFAEARKAELVHQIHFALANSKTWGDFQRLMPRSEYARVMEALEEDFDDDEAPGASDPFEAELVPGFSDGDYPEWLQQSMDEVLPAELLKRFAKNQSSVLNGGYWHIDAKHEHEHEHEIVEELRRVGHSVERRDDLTFG